MKSYDFSNFSEKNDELQRLEKQASLFLAQEKEIWMKTADKSASLVIDAGCGPGFTTKHLANHFNKGKVVGVELNQDLHNFSKEYIKNSKLKNIELIQGDICNIDFPDNSVDYIYSRLVFSHLPKPENALKEFHRILKPGGSFCILDIDDSWMDTVPHSTFLKQSLVKCMDIQIKHGGDREIGKKLGFYAQRAGFKRPQLKIELASNSILDLPTLFQIFMMGRIDYIGDLDRDKFISQLVEELENLKKIQAWILIAVFSCSAKKES